VTLQFGPQRIVTPAILASGAALVLCLVLGFIPATRIRRRLGRRGYHAAERNVTEPARDTVPAADVARQVPETGTSRNPVLDAPVLGRPFAAGGRTPHLLGCLLVAAMCGAMAMMALPPPWAVPVAGATAVVSLAGLRWGRARSILALCTVGCIGTAGVVTVFDQVRHHYAPGSGWPHNFETAGVLAFIGVVALATDSAVELARRHSRSEPQGDGR
jgi:hypothetical protein